MSRKVTVWNHGHLVAKHEQEQEQPPLQPQQQKLLNQTFADVSLNKQHVHMRAHTQTHTNTYAGTYTTNTFAKALTLLTISSDCFEQGLFVNIMMTYYNLLLKETFNLPMNPLAHHLKSLSMFYQHINNTVVLINQ